MKRLKACPRCHKSCPPGLSYFVCKDCGFAFDDSGTAAPADALDHPIAYNAVNECARAMEVVARLTKTGNIKREVAAQLAAGFLVACDLEIVNLDESVAELDAVGMAALRGKARPS